MRNIILVGAILLAIFKLSSSATTTPSVPDLCLWQQKRDELVSQLSPKGQESVKKILKNMETAIFGSVKPLLKLVTAEVSSNILKQNNKDSANLNTFLTILSYGIDMLPFSDSGFLLDLCGYQTNSRMAFSTLRPETQTTTANIFANIFNQVFPSVRRALVNQVSNTVPQNEQLIQQLKKTESSDNLQELNKLIGLKVF